MADIHNFDSPLRFRCYTGLLLSACFMLSCQDTAPSLHKNLSGLVSTCLWVGGDSVEIQGAVSYPAWASEFTVDLRIAADSVGRFSNFNQTAKSFSEISHLALSSPFTKVNCDNKNINLFGDYISVGIKDNSGVNHTSTVNLLQQPEILPDPVAFHQVAVMPDPNNNQVNTLWMIGGNLSASVSVNKSVDGLTWTPIATDVNFARQFHRVNVMTDPDNHTNTLWLTGGSDRYSRFYNDVWKSSDGIKWYQLNAGTSLFSARYGHATAVMPDPGNGNKSTLWLIGGVDNTGLLNDIWKTVDGTNWVKVTPTGTIFSKRSLAQLIVKRDVNGKDVLWLIGGYGPAANNDVWVSYDGVSWTKLTPNGETFSPRDGHQAIVMDDPTNNNINTIWVIGGIDGVKLAQKDVWKTTDGINWVKVMDETGAIFSARQYHQVAIMPDPINSNSNTMWLLGGEHGSDYTSDCWKSTDGAVFRQGLKFQFQF